MRIGEILWFSPRFRFSDLCFDDPKLLVEALRDRVEGFFLQPAARSLAATDAFAAGLVCCAAIELISKVSGANHPSAWLQSHIAAFKGDEVLAENFWKYFRDGLAHEGRVKSYGNLSGQFSLELSTLVTRSGSVIVVNPRLLLEAVQAAFHQYCDQMGGAEAEVVAKRLQRYFNAEVSAAKS